MFDLDIGGIAEDIGNNIGQAADDFLSGGGADMISDGISNAAEGLSNAAEDVLGGGGGEMISDGIHNAADNLSNAIDSFGVDVPNVNVDAISGAAAGWSQMADQVHNALDEASHASGKVGDENSGSAISKFIDSFTGHSNSPIPGGDQLVQGLDAAATGLLGSAGASHSAQIGSLVEGAQLAAKTAQAVFDAPATGGQSLSLIPGFQEEARTHVHNLVQTAADFLSGREGGPVSGILGEMLQGTGLIERLDGVAASTAPDASAPHAPGAPAPGPGAPPPPGGGGDARGLAQSYVDRHIPYAWGGGHGGEPGPTQGISDGGGAADAHGDFNKVGLDCSGLARDYLYHYKGIDIGPGATGTLINEGTPISEDQLQPGDLVYPNSGHVQVYIGDGQVLEAQQSGTDVMISPYGGGELRRYE